MVDVSSIGVPLSVGAYSKTTPASDFYLRSLLPPPPSPGWERSLTNTRWPSSNTLINAKPESQGRRLTIEDVVRIVQHGHKPLYNQVLSDREACQRFENYRIMIKDLDSINRRVNRGWDEISSRLAIKEEEALHKARHEGYERARRAYNGAGSLNDDQSSCRVDDSEKSFRCVGQNAESQLQRSANTHHPLEFAARSSGACPSTENLLIPKTLLPFQTSCSIKHSISWNNESIQFSKQATTAHSIRSALPVSCIFMQYDKTHNAQLYTKVEEAIQKPPSMRGAPSSRASSPPRSWAPYPNYTDALLADGELYVDDFAFHCPANHELGSEQQQRMHVSDSVEDQAVTCHRVEEQIFEGRDETTENQANIFINQKPRRPGFQTRIMAIIKSLWQ